MLRAAGFAHRRVLALHAGAVEPQGRHPLLVALDVQDAFVASLARLWLGQVLGLQGDGLDHLHRHQDLLRLQQLGTVLGREEATQQVSPWVSPSSDAPQTSHLMPCKAFVSPWDSAWYKGIHGALLRRLR